VHHGDDGEDRGGQATGAHEAGACGVNAEPVQGDEDVTRVLGQVQQQRRVAAQHRRQQAKPSAQPDPRCGGGCGGGPQVVR